ncbi:MAG TPA: type II secretion system minor pseudopilin GspK [Burkholderiaceae bacterium]|jgi:general secretion pathway protein K|nr:type II secretion system minor pseudopilin GspK [Burkholderiaceae bacterium]
MKLKRTQSGAALLMAMVIVTLIVSLAASMIWQQWRAVQVETAERARSQAAWILTGALDWARLILREDARNAGPDHLGEPWAVPLAEARLSTFLAADKENTEGAPDAFLSGSIADAQALYNLRNLVDGNGKIVPEELRALERLCTAVGVSLTTATNIANVMQGALAATASPDNEAPLLPGSVMQFAWAGVSADELRRLQPYVALLPRAMPVNLNTASREVLVAAIDGLDLSSAERLVQARQRNPFNGVPDAQALVPQGVTLNAQRVDIRSNFFEVRGRLRLGERALEERSLVERRGLDIVVIDRERLGLAETAR